MLAERRQTRLDRPCQHWIVYQISHFLVDILKACSQARLLREKALRGKWSLNRQEQVIAMGTEC
jgi:hypothetical protein